MAVNVSAFISEAQWDRLPEDTDYDVATERDFGRFDYVQITYECIRGFRENTYEEVAFYLHDGEWYPEKQEHLPDSKWVSCGPDTDQPGGVGWTDIVISEVKP